MWILVLQKITLEFLVDLLYFPLWWYTGGLKRALLFCVQLLKDGNDWLAPGLWLEHIFTPMFGQRDWQGRLMSFFMRAVNVIGRSLALLVWFLVVTLLFLAWLVFPIFAVYMLFNALL